MCGPISLIPKRAQDRNGIEHKATGLTPIRSASRPIKGFDTMLPIWKKVPKPLTAAKDHPKVRESGFINTVKVAQGSPVKKAAANATSRIRHD